MPVIQWQNDRLISDLSIVRFYPGTLKIVKIDKKNHSCSSMVERAAVNRTVAGSSLAKDEFFLVCWKKLWCRMGRKTMFVSYLVL